MEKYTGPFVYPTVDVAILNAAGGENLLLGRKLGKCLYQFIGGFADVNSPSYEDDAMREVKEECGINIFYPKYIGSIIVDDERYKGKADKIKTLFFIATFLSGTPKAMDDIIEIKWYELSKLTKKMLVPKHRVLFRMLKEYLEMC